MKEKSVLFFDIYYPTFYFLFVGRLQYQTFKCDIPVVFYE